MWCLAFDMRTFAVFSTSGADMDTATKCRAPRFDDIGVAGIVPARDSFILSDTTVMTVAPTLFSA